MGFRSTGSYEPDHLDCGTEPAGSSFDPQALTSLTYWFMRTLWYGCCFDPQALTSLTDNGMGFKDIVKVSIHRLLRA